MALIGALIDKLLKTGSITLVMPDGSRSTHGRGGGDHLTLRFADNRVGFDILRNPRLGLGEDAVEAIRGELDRRRADLDGFESVSRAAVFD